MDEIAVKAADAVLKRMNVNKAESQGLFGQVHPDKFFESLCTKDQRAKSRCARQVIPDPVARRVLTFNSPLLLGISGRHVGSLSGIG